MKCFSTGKVAQHPWGMSECQYWIQCFTDVGQLRKDQVICPFLFKGNLLILLLLKIVSEIAQLEDFNNGVYKFGF